MDGLQFLALILYQMVILVASPLFWLVVLVIAWSIRRTAKMKSAFFHVPRERILRKVVFNVLLGLAGGFVGSILLVLLGITIEEIGLEYLWILAIVLLFIRQRFMCFAYAGGILALSGYFFGWPMVNIPQLMGLIAVLHLVEALLIGMGSASKAMPVYTMGRDGQLVGGFVMQNFWPLPLAALSAGLAPWGAAGVGEVLAMPDWWPLLPMQYVDAHSIVGMALVYSLLPVLAALGYSDLALTMTAHQKAAASSRQLFVYSVGLLLLALLAAKLSMLAILPALYAPLGHEWLIKRGKRHEQMGDYLYTEQAQGVMVLDVLDGLAAKRAGLRAGDILLAIDGECLSPDTDLHDWQAPAVIEYERQGKRYVCHLTMEGDLGIIPVPRAKGLQYLEFGSDNGMAAAWAKRLRKKLSARRLAK